MTHDHEDDETLRRWFQAQAAEEEAYVPAFGLPAVLRRDRRPLRVLAASAAALALVAGALWLARAGKGDPPYPIDLAVVRWMAPTDFLLDTPGRTLLREVPAFEIRSLSDSNAPPESRDDTL